MKSLYSSKDSSLNLKTWIITLIVLTAITRLLLMWLLPLTDNTEARYAEIARLTAQQGFWLMPHVDLKTPFFAKPPLSTWINAASILILGTSEFAVRLPAFILSGISLYLTWLFAQDLKLKQPWFVLLSACISPIFFVCSGAVMTDATQMTVITFAWYAAWRILSTSTDEAQSSPTIFVRPTLWHWLFWLAIALGALTKGLATWFLIALPLIAFSIIERQVWHHLKRLYHLPAILLSGLIFITWYWRANQAHPGFIDYFIIGEHFSRFLVPGWSGDRYGAPHRVPLGMIWLFWAASILPWLGVCVSLIMRSIHHKWSAYRSQRHTEATQKHTEHDINHRLKLFLWCCVLAPLIFFSFARNIIAPYTLTSVLPFSLLLGLWFDMQKVTTQHRIVYSTALFPLIILIATPYIDHQLNLISDKQIVAIYQQNAKDTQYPLEYATKPNHSANFYTRENLQYNPSNWQSSNNPYIVMSTDYWLKNQSSLTNFTELARNKRHILLQRKNRP